MELEEYTTENIIGLRVNYNRFQYYIIEDIISCHVIVSWYNQKTNEKDEGGITSYTLSKELDALNGYLKKHIIKPNT